MRPGVTQAVLGILQKLQKFTQGGAWAKVHKKGCKIQGAEVTLI